MNNSFSNGNESQELMHEFMKCSRLMFAPFFGGKHHGMGHGHMHHMHNGNMNNENFENMLGRHMRGHLKEHFMHHKHLFQKIGQGRLLKILLENDGISQKALAELLQITPASVSELINKLEAGNCIEKRQNEDDKRITNIFLTEGGKFLAQKIKEEHDNYTVDLFSGLTEEEQTQLLALIKKLLKSLEEKKSEFDFKFGEMDEETDEDYKENEDEKRED